MVVLEHSKKDLVKSEHLLQIVISQKVQPKRAINLIKWYRSATSNMSHNSQVKINTLSSKTASELVDLFCLHKELERLISPQSIQVLQIFQTHRNKPYLLIQTEVEMMLRCHK